MFRVTQFRVCVCVRAGLKSPPHPGAHVLHIHTPLGAKTSSAWRGGHALSPDLVFVSAPKHRLFFLALDASVTDVSFKELFPTVGPSRVQSHVVTLP